MLRGNDIRVRKTLQMSIDIAELRPTPTRIRNLSYEFECFEIFGTLTSQNDIKYKAGSKMS